jgi:cytochrome c biogenesis protein
LKAIDVFANGFEGTPGGFTGVTAFIEKAVPEAEREQAANVIVKILNGVFWQLWEDGRSQLNLGPAPTNEASEKFVQASMGALSDTWFYPLPVIFQLKEFDQVQASVFQVTKAPGKKWVYVGCLFLVLGIFAMFYLPERRIWIRLKNTSQSGLFAMTSTRQTMDFEEEFEKYRQGIQAWKIN